MNDDNNVVDNSHNDNDAQRCPRRYTVQGIPSPDCVAWRAVCYRTYCHADGYVTAKTGRRYVIEEFLSVLLQGMQQETLPMPQRIEFLKSLQRLCRAIDNAMEMAAAAPQQEEIDGSRFTAAAAALMDDDEEGANVALDSIPHVASVARKRSRDDDATVASLLQRKLPRSSTQQQDRGTSATTNDNSSDVAAGGVHPVVAAVLQSAASQQHGSRPSRTKQLRKRNSTPKDPPPQQPQQRIAAEERKPPPSQYRSVARKDPPSEQRAALDDGERKTAVSPQQHVPRAVIRKPTATDGLVPNSSSLTDVPARTVASSTSQTSAPVVGQKANLKHQASSNDTSRGTTNTAGGHPVQTATTTPLAAPPRMAAANDISSLSPTPDGMVVTPAECVTYATQSVAAKAAIEAANTTSLVATTGRTGVAMKQHAHASIVGATTAVVNSTATVATDNSTTASTGTSAAASAVRNGSVVSMDGVTEPAPTVPYAATPVLTSAEATSLKGVDAASTTKAAITSHVAKAVYISLPSTVARQSMHPASVVEVTKGVAKGKVAGSSSFSRDPTDGSIKQKKVGGDTPTKTAQKLNEADTKSAVEYVAPPTSTIALGATPTANVKIPATPAKLRETSLPSSSAPPKHGMASGGAAENPTPDASKVKTVCPASTATANVDETSCTTKVTVPLPVSTNKTIPPMDSTATSSTKAPVFSPTVEEARAATSSVVLAVAPSVGLTSKNTEMTTSSVNIALPSSIPTTTTPGSPAKGALRFLSGGANTKEPVMANGLHSAIPVSTVAATRQAATAYRSGVEGAIPPPVGTTGNVADITDKEVIPASEATKAKINVTSSASREETQGQKSSGRMTIPPSAATLTDANVRTAMSHSPDFGSTANEIRVPTPEAEMSIPPSVASNKRKLGETFPILTISKKEVRIAPSSPSTSSPAVTTTELRADIAVFNSLATASCSYSSSVAPMEKSTADTAVPTAGKETRAKFTTVPNAQVSLTGPSTVSTTSSLGKMGPSPRPSQEKAIATDASPGMLSIALAPHKRENAVSLASTKSKSEIKSSDVVSAQTSLHPAKVTTPKALTVFMPKPETTTEVRGNQPEQRPNLLACSTVPPAGLASAAGTPTHKETIQTSSKNDAPLVPGSVLGPFSTTKVTTLRGKAIVNPIGGIITEVQGDNNVPIDAKLPPQLLTAHSSQADLKPQAECPQDATELTTSARSKEAGHSPLVGLCLTCKPKGVDGQSQNDSEKKKSARDETMDPKRSVYKVSARDGNATGEQPVESSWTLVAPGTAVSQKSKQSSESAITSRRPASPRAKADAAEELHCATGDSPLSDKNRGAESLSGPKTARMNGTVDTANENVSAIRSPALKATGMSSNLVITNTAPSVEGAAVLARDDHQLSSLGTSGKAKSATSQGGITAATESWANKDASRPVEKSGKKLPAIAVQNASSSLSSGTTGEGTIEVNRGQIVASKEACVDFNYASTLPLATSLPTTTTLPTVAGTKRRREIGVAYEETPDCSSEDHNIDNLQTKVWHHQLEKYNGQASCAACGVKPHISKIPFHHCPNLSGDVPNSCTFLLCVPCYAGQYSRRKRSRRPSRRKPF